MTTRDAARIRALERKALRKPLSLWEQAELAQLKQAIADKEREKKGEERA